MALQIGVAADPKQAGHVISGAWLQKPELKRAGLQVLQARRYTCRACGFQAKPTKELPHGMMIPVDLKHPGFLVCRPEAGLCLCPMCACALAINWSVTGRIVGGRELAAPGMLIFCPHLSQEQISRLALHTVAICGAAKVAQQTSLDAMAVSVDCAMAALNKDLQAYLPIYRDGQGSEFARALSLLSEEYYQHRGEILGPVRWWPNVSYWASAGEHWMETTYRHIHSQTPDLLELGA